MEVSWKVYNNVVKMLEYRNSIAEKGHNLVRQVFESEMYAKNFVSVVAHRQNDPHRIDSKSVIFILTSRNTAMHKTRELKRLIKLALSANATEMIIISENGIKIQGTNAIGTIAQEELGTMTIYNYPYHPFIFEVPRHVDVPKHIILSQDESKAILDYYNIKGIEMPKILKTDPVAIWLDIPLGAIVKIIRPSESAGTTDAYRLCIG